MYSISSLTKKKYIIAILFHKLKQKQKNILHTSKHNTITQTLKTPHKQIH